MSKEKPIERPPTSFDSFGYDLKEARNILKLSRAALAEKVGMDDRYLANIENSGYIPSLPLFYALVTACNMPVNKYFYPGAEKQGSQEHERLKLKMAYCPEKYLPMVEAVLSEAIKLDEADAK